MRFCPHCAHPLIQRELGGLTRLACGADGCDFVVWDNPVPVVAALVEHAGEIILARNQAWPEGAFGLITGYLEREEDPRVGVAREVAEELGLTAERVSLIGNYAFARKNQVLLAYHVLAHGEIRLNEELAEIRRVPPAQLRPWDFGTGFAVRDWLAGRMP